MELHRGLPLPTASRPTALAIGNFDGVHRGHQALIDALKAHAQPRNLACAVMTFEPHPREYFAKLSGDPSKAPLRISTLRDRLDALATHGVDTTFLLRFSKSLAGMSAEDFVHTLLVKACRARFVMVGEDFRFGTRRMGDVALIKAMGAQFGFGVATLSDVKENGQRISSTMVRTALAAGDMAQAAELLGRPYAISGHVLHGAKLGRTLDFPTLNVRVPFINPAARGIFVARVHGLGPQPLPGVASLGLRPTVDAITQQKQGRWLLETHLFDWQGDAYGKLVRVELLKKLRDEEKYVDLATLKDAIAGDAAAARKHFGIASGATTSLQTSANEIVRISTSSVSA
jgi:riboflavin kinase / FMN adenylyltransferase